MSGYGTFVYISMTNLIKKVPLMLIVRALSNAVIAGTDAPKVTDTPKATEASIC